MIDKAWLSQVQTTVQCDYIKWRPVFTVTTWSADHRSKLDRSEQTERQGDTMESVYWFNEGVNFEMKKKYKDTIAK